MDDLGTQTIFFLAQAYGAQSNIEESSKYCHQTMIRQLLGKKEFSRKEWATNAVHLSGFYNTIGAYGVAMHCLLAARAMMPTENPSEETLGVVAWGFVKFAKGRLHHARSVKGEANEKAASVGVTVREFLQKCPWWQDFAVPGVPPPTDVGPICDFESAREMFKLGNKEAQEAAKWYTYESSCPDYIAIQQDVAALYGLLIHWESDFERVMAMHQRRIDALKSFSKELHFNSYTTLIRQLDYDVGEMWADVLDMRVKQYQDESRVLGKPWSSKRINEVQANAVACFEKFFKSCYEKDKEELPKGLDKELYVPLFRVLQRLARLENRRIYKTPQEEYDAIGSTIVRYNALLKYVDTYNLGGHPDLQQEISMARELVTLLPAKQRDVHRVFAR